MYLALYRKFRPAEFDKVIGQEHITRTLRNQIKNDQIGHAYLFCGSRGTGKTTCAKVFARAINCKNPKDGSPCGECSTCLALKENNAIDIIEIDAASNNGVEEIRDLREKVKYPPTVGKYKVYIIDEVHMLTTSAFNALLKTLEEPPAHAVFILATTEVHKLPATILSRVLRFDFKLVSTELLSKHLTNIFKESNITAEESAINLIAINGQGSVRDTLSIADMCASFANNNIKYNDVVEVLGVSDKETILNIGESILRSDVKTFFTTLDTVAKQGKNLTVLVSDLVKFFRDVLVIQTCNANIDLAEYKPEILEKMKALAESVETKSLNDGIQNFSKIETELKYSLNQKLLIEATALGLISFEAKKKLIASKVESYSITIPQKVLTQDPRAIWGKMLLKMRKDGNILLHSASIEIDNVKIENGNLVIGVNNIFNYQTLKKQQNLSYLVDCLKVLGYNLNVELILDESKKEKDDKSVLLQKILGFKINVI